MLFRCGRVSIRAFFLFLLSFTSFAEEQPDIEKRIDDLLKQMTLAEKVTLLHGDSKFNVAGIKRLTIPPIALSDGPHGVRRENARDTWAPAGWTNDQSTYLPTGSALAATWNRDMARLFGDTLGAEARDRKKDIILGPGINIVRTPLCGRNFEYFGEDPYQVGEMAAGVVRAIQSNDVACCVKHFALNNQEWNRGWVNAVVDERTLREIYLPAFEKSAHAGAWTFMAAYNRVGGQYCAENKHLVRDILKGEWGFDGVYISDWGGTHSTKASAENGLDIEMGTSDHYDTYFLAKPLRKAVEDHDIAESVVDEKVRRILRMMIRTGMLDPEKRKAGSRNTKEHQQAARDIASEAIVLLKNDGVLPLDASTIRKIAVIGDNADKQHGSQGGSSEVKTLYEITPLEGLKEKAGQAIQISFVRGYRDVNQSAAVEPIRESCIQTFDSKTGVRSWKAEFFNNPNLKGAPVLVRYDKDVNFNWGEHAPASGIGANQFSARWTAEIRPAASGTYLVALTSDDGSRLKINDKQVVNNWGDHGEETRDAKVELVAGQTYRFVVEYYDASKSASISFGWAPPGGRSDPETEFSEALKAAREADAVIVFAGLNHRYDQEGVDRRDLSLPGRQNELIAALAAANPRTAVFITSGSAVEMPWIDQVKCVAQNWYAGMEGGRAIANVIFGDVNPSGKLPVTFPKKLEDSPAHAIGEYNDNNCEYKEGLLVGYRYYDTKNVEPLFPFGHGLSYTEFKYSNLKIDPAALTVSVDIANSGKVKGREVAQLYIRDVESSVPRPIKELKGFEKVELAPGETKSVVFKLDQRSFSFYDAQAKRWVAEPGQFEILVGSSSKDIRVQGILELKTGT